MLQAEPKGKHAQFKWESTHQHAFDALTNPPILDYPKRYDTFVLATDASDTGLGAVLSTARGTAVEITVTLVAKGTDLDNATIAAAQKSDPVLHIVIQQMLHKEKPLLAGSWRKFPLKWFHQIWPILYHKVKTPTMHKEKLLLVVPTSLQKQLLKSTMLAIKVLTGPWHEYLKQLIA